MKTLTIILGLVLYGTVVTAVWLPVLWLQIVATVILGVLAVAAISKEVGE